MPTAHRACPTPGCPNTVPRQQPRCDHCQQASEYRRGTAHQRGYDRHHRARFRETVLARDPICTCPPHHPTHHGQPCHDWSTVADHHPTSRKDLEATGQDPNDPAHGRGLCESCHNWHTSRTQPGGWNSNWPVRR